MNTFPAYYNLTIYDIWILNITEARMSGRTTQLLGCISCGNGRMVVRCCCSYSKSKLEYYSVIGILLLCALLLATTTCAGHVLMTFSKFVKVDSCVCPSVPKCIVLIRKWTDTISKFNDDHHEYAYAYEMHAIKPTINRILINSIRHIIFRWTILGRYAHVEHN